MEGDVDARVVAAVVGAANAVTDRALNAVVSNGPAYAAGAAGGAPAPSAALLALNAAGFSASGVVAGSLAAGIQSAWYGAYTGGMFSLAQSAGAVGLGVAGTAVAAVSGGLLVGGAVAGGIALVRRRTRQRFRDTVADALTHENVTASMRALGGDAMRVAQSLAEQVADHVVDAVVAPQARADDPDGARRVHQRARDAAVDVLLITILRAQRENP